MLPNSFSKVISKANVKLSLGIPQNVDIEHHVEFAKTWLPESINRQNFQRRISMTCPKKQAALALAAGHGYRNPVLRAQEWEKALAEGR